MTEGNAVALITPSSTTGDFAELKHLVKQARLLEKQPHYYMMKLIVVFAFLALGIAFLLFVKPFWLQLLNAAFLGLITTQFGLLGHAAPQDNISTSNNCDRITHFVSTQQCRQNLEIGKGRSAHFCSPWEFAAITNQVEAIFATAIFNGEVRFSTWWMQGNRHTSTNGSRRHLFESKTAEMNALSHFHHPYHVACKTATFLAYLHLDSHFTIRHAGTMNTQIPVDTTGSGYWTSQPISNGLLRIDETDSLCSREKDFVSVDEGFKLFRFFSR